MWNFEVKADELNVQRNCIYGLSSSQKETTSTTTTTTTTTNNNNNNNNRQTDLWE